MPWAYWCAEGRQPLKMVRTFPSTQRSEMRNLGYFLYKASILGLFAPSDGVLWNAEAN